jgi:hypothetical protein
VVAQRSLAAGFQLSALNQRGEHPFDLDHFRYEEIKAAGGRVPESARF